MLGRKGLVGARLSLSEYNAKHAGERNTARSQNVCNARAIDNAAGGLRFRVCTRRTSVAKHFGEHAHRSAVRGMERKKKRTAAVGTTCEPTRDRPMDSAAVERTRSGLFISIRRREATGVWIGVHSEGAGFSHTRFWY